MCGCTVQMVELYVCGWSSCVVTSVWIQCTNCGVVWIHAWIVYLCGYMYMYIDMCKMVVELYRLNGYILYIYGNTCV